MRRSLKLPDFRRQRRRKTDYSEYDLSLREGLWVFLKSACVTGAFAYMFYRSWIGMLVWPAVFAFLWKKELENAAGKRRERLAVQFRDLALGACACMQAGYSVENAFLEAAKEIGALHGKECEMFREMEQMKKGMLNGIPLEQMLEDLGKRSHVEEVRDFTESFAVAKRQGGNLREMIRRTAALTGQRMDVEREIQTLLAAKRYEQKVMNCIPFLLFVWLEVTSKGFFDILYHNTAGVLVMTACLGIYLAAVFLSEKIMDIKL